MSEILLTGATARPAAQSAFALCVSVLLLAIFLQKIALPGTRAIYPLILLIFPSSTAAAFLAGLLEVNTAAFIWYAGFILVGILSTAVSPSPHVSVLSLGFLVVAQLPLVFRCKPSNIPNQRVLDFLSMLG